jgi:glycosyltransferase involved in cell wall biosynthesis
MLLSIVIPTHNRFAYLQRCLEALCAEAPRTLDCEITVIDDGSRADIAEKNKALCREKGVGYYYDEQNAGAAAARNRGIEISTGEWVAFIDDDVCVETGWGIRCEEILRTIPADVAGIEGRVIATGSGVWDREVENTKGALYLSCHIFYRKETLDAAGKFDEHFSSRYPSCEDHELAVRVRLRGDIIFVPGLCVRHLPRKVNLPRYCWDSFYRMRSLLDAELYFFLKHRDRYHTARHATSFWGTYRNIIIRHLYSTVKRRRFSMLAKHPPQSVALLISCALEQAYALLVVPKIFRRYQSNPYQFFRQRMNEDRTRDAWKIAADSSVTALALKPRFLRSLLFRLLRSPVCRASGGRARWWTYVFSFASMMSLSKTPRPYHCFAKNSATQIFHIARESRAMI